MELSEQVVSLELAKRLKELGVPQLSIFYWVKNADGVGYTLYYRKGGTPDYWQDYYAAFTIAELGELLPDNIHFSKTIGDAKENGEWIACMDYECEEFDDGRYFNSSAEAFFGTEAEARGLMLAYLLEHGLLTLTK